MGKQTFSLFSTCGPEKIIGMAFNATRRDEHSFKFAQNGLFTLKIIDAQLDGRTVQMRSHNRMTTSTEADLIRPDE